MDQTNKKLERIFAHPGLTKDDFIKLFGIGYPSLYSLRRDVYWCRAIDPKHNKILFEGAGSPLASIVLMRILLDYLVNLCSSNFQNYITRYFKTKLDMEQLEVLNRLRNAIVHKSYNLVWFPKEAEKGKITYFAITVEQIAPLIEQIKESDADESWAINIDKLHQEIEYSINNLYKQALKDGRLSKKIMNFASDHLMHVVSLEVFARYKNH